jgi:hypothetical protein
MSFDLKHSIIDSSGIRGGEDARRDLLGCDAV